MSVYTTAAMTTGSASSSSSALSSGETEVIKLTRREVEVLSLVIEGKSSKEVADHLFVSKRTVDFHLANIYSKLDVTNRVQAFQEAARRGLIPYQVLSGVAAARQ